MRTVYSFGLVIAVALLTTAGTTIGQERSHWNTGYNYQTPQNQGSQQGLQFQLPSVQSAPTQVVPPQGHQHYGQPAVPQSTLNHNTPMPASPQSCLDCFDNGFPNVPTSDQTYLPPSCGADAYVAPPRNWNGPQPNHGNACGCGIRGCKGQCGLGRAVRNHRQRAQNCGRCGGQCGGRCHLRRQQQPVYQQPVYQQPVHNHGYGNGNGVSSCDTGACGDQAYDYGCGLNTGAGPISGHGYNSDYTYGTNYAVGPRRPLGVYVNVNAIGFNRDYEDEVWFSYPNGDPLGRGLTSRHAEINTFTGVEVKVGREFCNGFGWELGYWGLFSRSAEFDLAGYPTFRLPTIDYLTYDDGTGPATVDTFINNSAVHRVRRTNEFHNIEINMFRRTLASRDNTCNSCIACNPGGPRGQRFRVDWTAGARFLKFDENFSFRTSYDGLFAFDTRDLYYDINLDNNLVGFQMGNRFRYCLTNNLTFQGATKVGIYGNQINSRQEFYGANGYATVNTGGYTGDDYDIDSDKVDVSFLGEMDLGFRYRFGCNWTLTGGYRIMGVSGIALAPNQIPRDFSDIASASQINSNGNLILHGGYAGLEYNY